VITTRPTQVLGVSQLAPRNTKLKGTGRTEHALVVDDVIGFPCGEAEDTDDLVWCRGRRSGVNDAPARRRRIPVWLGPAALDDNTRAGVGPQAEHAACQFFRKLVQAETDQAHHGGVGVIAVRATGDIAQRFLGGGDQSLARTPPDDVGFCTDPLVLCELDHERIDERLSDAVLVSVGQHVDTSTPLGVLGATGTEGFPHIHYEVARGINGDPVCCLVDPQPFLRGEVPLP